ncbi:MAG: U32 family peptidase [Rhodospirillales bacterium]|nr:U32 family peptidase [Alphaproteobacteria bacterium]USO06450.1 MAG: U32 family peptidase [Rhodospirillales bacterium]
MSGAELTIGPILFHWSADKKRDFYFRIADEAPVDTVYIGEVICSKRAPFFEPYYDEVAERLTRAGKKIVFSSLAEIMLPREQKMTKGLCELEEYEVEANDAAALYHLRGKPHRVGQYFNVYNEDTMAHLTSQGAVHFTVPSELPKEALSVLSNKAEELNVGLEVQVYGRTGLALSARCYHARSHNRVKDNCQFVCEEDPDGMELKTLDGKPFLSVNGIQTLSHTCLNLMHEVNEMQGMGITHFRLSPHSHDMVSVARAFRAVLDKDCAADEGVKKLEQAGFKGTFSRGFYHGNPGYAWKTA